MAANPTDDHDGTAHDPLFGSRLLRWAGPAVLVLSGAIMFTQLGGPRLWDRDEPRNAGCAAEMLAANDWVTPVFNGELRSHKPVLLYWLMMPGYHWLGVNEFTARLPSAALAVGACLLTFFIGSRLFQRRVGLLAACILCTTMMFVVAGRAATPDSVLIFLTTAATAVFVAWAFPSSSRGRADTDSGRPLAPELQAAALPWSVALGMYALMGLAVLAKGPVGLVLPTAVIGMFLLLQRLSPSSIDEPRWRGAIRAVVRSFYPPHFLRTCWWMRPATAVAVALAVALPWYVWVGLRTDGAWLEGFLLEHNLGRAMRPMESHGGGPWYYPLALLAGFFPWSIFAAPTLAGVCRTTREDPDRRAALFCVCWAGVYVGLFTIARTKLPSYVTPCYPALALLTSWQLCCWIDSPRQTAFTRPWLAIGFGALALVGVGMLIGLPIAASQLLAGEQWLAVGGLAPLGTAWLAWRAARNERPAAAVRIMTAGAAVLVLAAFAFFSQHVSKHQQFDQLLSSIHARSESPQIAAYRCMEPSWVFYARQRIGQVWLADSASPEQRRREAARPRWSPDPPREDLAAFLESPDSFVITTRWQYDRVQQDLPADTEVIATAPLFLKQTDLLVLQRPSTAARLAMKPPRQRDRVEGR